MTPPFSVRTTSRFERLARTLRKGHTEFHAILNRAIAILEADPQNRSREHNIRKLEAIPLGDGQWRLAAS